MMPVDAMTLGVEYIWAFSAEQGRLPVADILSAEVLGVKRLAVLVGAPGSMADDVRREVVAKVGIGAIIDYHEDSFA
jgi:hypothetical protein